jgi:menaquinone-specific isochorismate synthase
VTTTGRRIEATSAPALVARTVAVPEMPDLLDVAGDDGLMWREEDGGLAAHGTVLRLDLPGGLGDASSVGDVRRALEAIVVEDEVGLPGCGPVAIGALPFDPTAPGTLVVPRHIVGCRAGQAWVTTVEPVDGDSGPPGGQTARPAAELVDRIGVGRDAPGAAPNDDPPDEFTLTPSLPHHLWKARVADALERIEAGEFEKVVLARRVDITANRPFVKSDVLARLVALYPSCMVFSMAGFIGASPELLVARTGDRVVSHPLAGTVARSGDAHADEALVAGLMASPKARREHGYVIDVLAAALRDVCVELEVPDRPSVMSLRNVSHLATRITARLDPRTPLTALELAARIHPTPAVGGNPASVVLPYLQSVEGFDRGRYAGPVGWVDARGDGAWAIGIRSAEVDGARASIFAGNGLVKGSDPADELTETQLKLQALLAALVRP